LGLFSQAIARAQRQYADCIGSIRELERVMGRPPIDGPSSPALEHINGVREYEVPFEAIQNTDDPTEPPRRIDAVVHAIAAVDTANNIVAERKLCELTLSQVRGDFDAWLAMRTAPPPAPVCPQKRPRR